MATTYILNSAVLTAPGIYRYTLLDQPTAMRFLQANNWLSRVGYQATAEHIRTIAGVSIPLSREETRMQAGDEALVVRLKYRLPDPRQKAQHQPGPNDWEYGLLTRE